MNRKLARTIAETITNAELSQMFENAKEKISDWTIVSNVNPTMTKGTTWNILTRAFDVKKENHILAKINMVREFGEYLPEQTVGPYRKTKRKSDTPPTHQEPIFTTPAQKKG